jgi:hypothetical protein
MEEILDEAQAVSEQVCVGNVNKVLEVCHLQNDHYYRQEELFPYEQEIPTYLI